MVRCSKQVKIQPTSISLALHPTRPLHLRYLLFIPVIIRQLPLISIISSEAI